MAITLLDGSSANIDFTTTISGTSGGTVSAKCFSNYLSADFSRQMLDKTTFCGTGWVGRFPSLKEVTGRIEGFSFKGNALADPLAWFAATASATVTFTADTGCSLTGQAFCSADHTGLRAAANSERGINWASDGAWSSAWVVT